MKTQHLFCFLAAFAILFTACKKNDEQQIQKETLSGYAQKGPLVIGSSVTIAELNASYQQTGKTYHASISNNLGSFELNNIELASQYIELKADGYYFNEVSGQTSGGTLTLYALADIENVNSVNVNVLTHLEKPRIEYLTKQQGVSFAAAKRQAQQEILAIFGFTPQESSSEMLNLTSDAKLLAISCILQGQLSTGDMVELMAQISADIRQNGKLNNIAIGSKLMNNAVSINLSLSEIRVNLTKKYAELGISVTIPDFENYIKTFINSELYPQTIAINYPKTGLHGDNILSDEVTEISPTKIYSMRAEVPVGLSLTVMLKNGLWFYDAMSPINWMITTYDDNTRSQRFTIMESGKISDLSFLPSGKSEYITIEYYENEAVTPTKIKTLNVK
ncbi:MAG: hypothetical protein FWC34_04790 [Bacteroidetes bacterium]|nr:hypothetical protein [Bacteroidota bacterium]MCL2303651.1 hypothetical protein [Lentimicrobiaceae bacterium]